MAIKASKGPGTYASEEIPSLGPELTDGRRIVSTDGSRTLLEIFMLDYRSGLHNPDTESSNVFDAIRRFLLTLLYFFRVLALVIPARRRAKRPIAKLQLVIGFGATVVMFLSVIFTALAVLVALGIWQEPVISGNAADAIALGATAFTTWLLLRVRPKVRHIGNLIEQVLDYAENERHAASVAGPLETALDRLIEADGSRKIYIFGYSLGALVAMDFLFPRSSLGQTIDKRHSKSIGALLTVGCPVDFVRLFLDDYTEGREARVPKLRWCNIFIAADILGSNLVDGNDEIEAPPSGSAGNAGGVHQRKISDEQLVCHRYTNERLGLRNVWGARGFLSHIGYWDHPEIENCLHFVMREIIR
jgi:pimeloyl-ACP methyl ester carboxylesterase